MQQVDRLAGAVISHVGGGVQPANRGMFCYSAPIWRLLEDLGAVQGPLRARTATKSLFLIEVFPALALPSLDDRFAARNAAPKYNLAQSRKLRL